MIAGGAIAPCRSAPHARPTMFARRAAPAADLAPGSRAGLPPASLARSTTTRTFIQVLDGDGQCVAASREPRAGAAPIADVQPERSSRSTHAASTTTSSWSSPQRQTAGGRGRRAGRPHARAVEEAHDDRHYAPARRRAAARSLLVAVHHVVARRACARAGRRHPPEADAISATELHRRVPTPQAETRSRGSPRR